MLSRKSLPVYLLTLATILPAIAQTQTTPAPATAAKPAEIDGGTPTYLRPETPEQRAARIGTEDPGPNPDLTKIYWRYGKKYMIEKAERQWAVYTGGDPGWIRPFGFANIYRELYQQNDKYVWTWTEIKDPERGMEIAEANPAPNTIYPDRSLQYFKTTRPEFAALQPTDAPKAIRFVESSAGLPDSGSWRNGLTTADMNEDGFVDLIAAPERGGGNLPAIFLGDGKGGWKFWDTVKWPVGLNYGGVAAADFNNDKHMDLVFGVHLDGVHVMLGDGKGNFTDASDGLPRDFPTRRVAVADLDRDGAMDIITISEGPTTLQTGSAEYAKLRVYYNREKGKKWVGENATEPGREFGGDWLSVGNFNADKYPDFVTASVYYNSPDVLYLSQAAKKWKNVGGSSQLAGGSDPTFSLLAYHFANTAGKFTSKKRDDAIISTVRFWPEQLPNNLVAEPPLKTVVGVERVDFSGAEPKRVPIMRWKGTRGVNAMGNGDFDGDGNLDVVFLRYDPLEFVILLGDGKGGFTRAAVEGMKPQPNAAYDMTVADVNGDKKPDVLISYEATGNTRLGTRDGSIRVFLNRGAADAAAAPVTAAK